MKRFFLVVVVPTLILAAPVRANFVTRLCGLGWGALVGPTAPAEPFFSPAEREALEAFRDHYAATDALFFSPDQAWLALSELPPPLLKKLFVFPTATSDSYTLREGIAHGQFPIEILQGFLQRRRWQMSPEALFTQVTQQIDTVAGRPESERAALGTEIAVRIENARAEARLMNRRTPEYAVRFEGEELIVPDGKRYRYHRGWGGALRIEVAYRDLLRTQTYENTEVVTGYLKDPALGRYGFEGELCPDGRFEISDQHHRIKAYALSHPGPDGTHESSRIPMLVRPLADGGYYTLTHFQILNIFVATLPNSGVHRPWRSDRSWSFLSEAGRRRLVEGSLRSPIAAIRDLYYQSTGLTRLAPAP